MKHMSGNLSFDTMNQNESKGVKMIGKISEVFGVEEAILNFSPKQEQQRIMVKSSNME